MDRKAWSPLHPHERPHSAAPLVVARPSAGVFAWAARFASGCAPRCGSGRETGELKPRASIQRFGKLAISACWWHPQPGILRRRPGQHRDRWVKTPAPPISRTVALSVAFGWRLPSGAGGCERQVSCAGQLRVIQATRAPLDGLTRGVSSRQQRRSGRINRWQGAGTEMRPGAT
jgi:hypothetical protein